jgi:hypothetical protein
MNNETKKAMGDQVDMMERNQARVLGEPQATTRKYQDMLFRKLFGEKQRAIELCNAIVGTNYSVDSEVRFMQSNDIIARYNDLAFAIDQQLIVMIEAQSTKNNNMPLRFFQYMHDILVGSFIGSRNIYGDTLIKIPTPRFYMLYNGLEPLSASELVLRLSDSYIATGGDGQESMFGVDQEPMLELIVHVMDIGYDKGNQVLTKSASLQGYSYLTAQVKRNIAAGMVRDMAIRQAMDHCIRHGILEDFLRDNFEEVLKVLNYEYDAELERRVLMEEGFERGMEEGKIKGIEVGLERGKIEGIEVGLERGKIEGLERGKIEIAKKLLSMKMTVDQVVSATGLNKEEVEGLQ